jgi:hypothetical protein
VPDETLDRILQRVATWPGVTVTTPANATTAGDATDTRTETSRLPGGDGSETGPDPPVEGTLVQAGDTVLAGLRDDGLLDLPVDRRLRDQLLTEGRADRHPAVPAGNRLSYRIDAPTDVTGAMWLLRVAHLTQCCREGTLPQTAVARRVRALRLSPELARLVRSDGLRDSPGATDGRRSVRQRRSRD